MYKVRALAYWIVGCLILAGTPLWLEWTCASKQSKNLRADHLAGLSRIAGEAGLVEDEFKLLCEAERIRNNWVNVVIDCKSEQEMKIFGGHLLAEAIGKSWFTKQIEKLDGSWQLHMVVENEVERDRLRERVSRLRFEIASEAAKQAGIEKPATRLESP